MAKINASPASRLGDRHIAAGETTQYPLAVADNDANPLQCGFLTLCGQISHASSLGVKVIVNLRTFKLPCPDIDALPSCEGEKRCIAYPIGDGTTHLRVRNRSITDFSNACSPVQLYF
ncbi:hypothetical protein NDU88_002507 [Pleurodeles waltl]|uniref:Uncharacterized protein n=1 Tax=Pleurodeles waltl TaxID=8319 RepID=A0AAV7VEM1_PLEWA|nr:hypothetical protein NDU88_002507 [Pleurodeles waltl]